MNPKQQLEKGYQDVSQLKNQLTAVKTKNTKQANLIEKLTKALDNLTKQYEDMLRASDAVIAAQADRIKLLVQENRELRRQLEELKKNAG